MNNVSKSIGWADYTWNPITGCSKASEGCANCYAERISQRFGLPWGQTVFHPERLSEPSKKKKPALIFVCSMSDIFHPTVKTEWLDSVIEVVASNPRHKFLMLTKRPENIPDKFPVYDNLWVGVTIENGEMNQRWLMLFDRYVGHKFISYEPLLSVNFIPRNVDWVIAGPENGANKRPCKGEWIDDMAKDAHYYGIPFYDKRKDFIRREWPKEMR